MTPADMHRIAGAVERLGTQQQLVPENTLAARVASIADAWDGHAETVAIAPTLLAQVYVALGLAMAYEIIATREPEAMALGQALAAEGRCRAGESIWHAALDEAVRARVALRQIALIADEHKDSRAPSSMGGALASILALAEPERSRR